MKKVILILLISVVAIFEMGCANESRPTTANPVDATDTWDPNQPYVPPSSGPGNGPGAGPGTGSGVAWQYGGTADLENVNIGRLADYLSWTPNNPQNLKVNLNLIKMGNGYGGTVALSFSDSGQNYVDYFTSKATKYGTVKSNSENNKYNIWFQKSGQTVYHGFFQDYYGAIIVVIDNVQDLGDGQGPSDLVDGSIWYKNHDMAYAPISPTSCWFVSIGPYDCRAWKSGDGVDTKRAIYPDAGYQKLGEFKGISLEESFNGEL